METYLSIEQKEVSSGFVRIVARNKARRHGLGARSLEQEKAICAYAAILRVKVRYRVFVSHPRAEFTNKGCERSNVRLTERIQPSLANNSICQ